jgi:hypothetical protein
MPRRTDPDQSEPPPPSRPLRPPAVPESGDTGRHASPSSPPPAIPPQRAGDQAAPQPDGTLTDVPPAAPPPEATFPATATVADLLYGDQFERDRFQIGTISGTWTVRDLDTGHVFILKRSGRIFDTINEVIVSRFHEALGRDYARARFVGDEQSWVLLQHVNDYPDDGILLGLGAEFVGPTGLMTQSALRGFVRRLADPLEPLRLLLGDFIVDNTDRHNKNWLVMSVASAPGGLLKPEPCDHGFCLLGRGASGVRGPAEQDKGVRVRTEETGSAYDDTNYDAYLEERLQAGATLPRYLRDQVYNPPAAFQEMVQLSVQSRRVSADRVAAEHDRVVGDWANALETVRLDDLDPAHVGRCRRLMATRIATLLAQRDRYVRGLTSGSW